MDFVRRNEAQRHHPLLQRRATLAAVVSAVRAVPDVETELIVVDDASTDGTPRLIASELAGEIDVHICHDRNRGKGDVVLIQDADLEYDP